jgi:hypothetical protein
MHRSAGQRTLANRRVGGYRRVAAAFQDDRRVSWTEGALARPSVSTVHSAAIDLLVLSFMTTSHVRFAN